MTIVYPIAMDTALLSPLATRRTPHDVCARKAGEVSGVISVGSNGNLKHAWTLQGMLLLLKMHLFC